MFLILDNLTVHHGKIVKERLEDLVAPVLVAVAHSEAGGALFEPKVGYEGLADTDPGGYIAEPKALVELSESKGDELVVGLIPATPLVAFVLVGAAGEHPTRYKVEDLADDRFVRIFSSPEESY